MKSGTYLNILEQRDSCNVEELHRVILDVYKMETLRRITKLCSFMK